MSSLSTARTGPLRAVLLDALGTIVQLEPPWPRLVALLRERHGVTITTHDARGALLTEMRYYRTACIGASDPAKLAALREECTTILARELGAPVASIARAELQSTLLDALHFAAYPDAVEALKRWRREGLRLIIVSNWDISLHDVLRQTGLRELLDGVVTSAEVGAAKPDPALFAAGLALAGSSPDESVFVGDSVAEDIIGAHAAGIRAVLLRRDADAEDSLDPPADVRVLASLREW
jgi:putative hydrolase of the HAD superfamily